MNSYKTVVGNTEVNKPLGRLGTDGKAIKSYHKSSLLENFGLVSTGYDYGSVTEFFKYDHKHLGVIQADKCLEQPDGY
jgi:hypothetical protein